MMLTLRCPHCGTVHQTEKFDPCPNCHSLKRELLHWLGYALGAALAVAVIGFTAGYIIEGLAPVAANIGHAPANLRGVRK